MFPSSETIPLSTGTSATARALEELQLYGYRGGGDDPDPRPLPDERALQAALADAFDGLVSALGDTRLEPDLDDILWALTNVFHRTSQKVERSLDSNEQAQRRAQRDQDGSEVRSVELERLVAEGQSLIERRDAYEWMRDRAAEFFELHLGTAWRPRTGSMVNHQALTASVVDSRDFLAAQARSRQAVLMPAGPKIVFTGGMDFNDHNRIWTVLDKVLAKHPGLVLLHGGAPKGAECIAACWADHRKVAQMTFKPDWARHAKAAPFKRNDAMLAVLPIGVVVFPGTGIQDNIADKARMMGLPVLDHRGRA